MGSAAAGGAKKPAADEVGRRWAEVTGQTRLRWETLRTEIRARRAKRHPA